MKKNAKADPLPRIRDCGTAIAVSRGIGIHSSVNQERAPTDESDADENDRKTRGPVTFLGYPRSFRKFGAHSLHLQPINAGSDASGAETVVDIDYGDV